MPFPSKEIEEAYERAIPIVQGCFKEDLELVEISELVQRYYTELQKSVDQDTLRTINALTQPLQEFQAY